MSHQWVFDVLRDLQAYAVANDLPQLADKVGEAHCAAQLECGPDLDEEAWHDPAAAVFVAPRLKH